MIRHAWSSLVRFRNAAAFEAIFSKLELNLKFVGRLPEEMNSRKKTQRIF
jgi:hypothetical protein